MRSIYSVFTNFRLELTESSAREVFNFWTLGREREERGDECGEEKGTWLKPSQTRNSSVRAQKKLLTLNLSSRRFTVKTSGHAVYIKQGLKSICDFLDEYEGRRSKILRDLVGRGRL